MTGIDRLKSIVERVRNQTLSNAVMMADEIEIAIREIEDPEFETAEETAEDIARRAQNLKKQLDELQRLIKEEGIV